MGMRISPDRDGLWAHGARAGCAPSTSSTLPYPGIATDYKPLLVAMLAVADGVGIVTENLFAGRFRYVDELVRMGADIRTEGHHAVVRGVERLSGAPVRAPDIRAGAALVVAGAAAPTARPIVARRPPHRPGLRGPRRQAAGARRRRRGNRGLGDPTALPERREAQDVNRVDRQRAACSRRIDAIRPALQADGGDIVLIDVDEDTGVVDVELVGACGSCPVSTMTLKAGIERILKDRVPGVTEVGQRRRRRRRRRLERLAPARPRGRWSTRRPRGDRAARRPADLARRARAATRRARSGGSVPAHRRRLHGRHHRRARARASRRSPTGSSRAGPRRRRRGRRCSPSTRRRPFTGGAILGDRVRMQDHATDAGVFIRSMATRGHLGGLALATPEAVRVLDAAGCPWVLVETVGVGQVEVEIAGAADTTVVVVNPGWGDAVQANKAGLLEIADVFVINKADRPGVERARARPRARCSTCDRTCGEWRPPDRAHRRASTARASSELWDDDRRAPRLPRGERRARARAGPSGSPTSCARSSSAGSSRSAFDAMARTAGSTGCATRSWLAASSTRTPRPTSSSTDASTGRFGGHARSCTVERARRRRRRACGSTARKVNALSTELLAELAAVGRVAHDRPAGRGRRHGRRADLRRRRRHRRVRRARRGRGRSAASFREALDARGRASRGR